MAEEEEATPKKKGTSLYGISAASGKIAEAVTDPLSTYFTAEATKEVARQRKEEAALKANAPLLHELDVPFIQCTFNAGTKRKPIPVRLNLTLLNIFGFGDFTERVLADYAQIKNKGTPNNFSREWDDIRTPRTSQPGTTTNPPTSLTASQLAALTAEQKDTYNKALDSAALAALGRGDFGSAIGFWFSKK